MEGLGMRIITLIVFLLACKCCFSDTIQKWTDESGHVHYGDRPPAATPHKIERLEIESNFDPVAYERAMKRNLEIEAEVMRIERHEKERAKRAEKRLDDYFRDLDRKKEIMERAKENKRKHRESERNRSSIKLKRSRQLAESSKTQTSSSFKKK
jgi:hypothetical protein